VSGEREDVGTVADLHASATRITGLSDFGADDYTDGLAVLLESYARDAALTPLGRKAQRSFLRGALVARLLSEAAWQACPDYECGKAGCDEQQSINPISRTRRRSLRQRQRVIVLKR